MRSLRAPVSFVGPLGAPSSAILSALNTLTLAQKTAWVLSGGGMACASLLLTPAQLNASFGAPITIVPAPGAGLVLQPRYFLFTQALGAAVFSAARTFRIRFNGLTTDPFTGIAMVNTANVYRQSWTCATGNDGWLANEEPANRALMFSADAAATLGSGSFRADVFFSLSGALP